MKLIIGFWAFWLMAQAYNAFDRWQNGPPDCFDHTPACMPEPTPP